MYTITPMIIKLLCIISLLYVTSTAQIFGNGPSFPQGEGHHRLRHLLENDEGDGKDAQGGGLVGLGSEKANEEDREKQGEEEDDGKLEKPKKKENLLKDSFNKENKEEEILPEEDKGDEIEEKIPKNKNDDEPKFAILGKDDQQKKFLNPQPNLPKPHFHHVPKIPVPTLPVPNIPIPQLQGEIAETKYKGKWEIVSLNAGVSAMHLQLLPTTKFAMFDATSLGKSSIELPPNRCRLVPNTTNQFDCFAHAVEYDPVTNNVRTLKVETNPWCSSGGLSVDGALINTGGWEEGEKSIRFYESCDTCDWKESNIKLADNRWYATQAMLADGRFILVGGRRAFNYELLTPTGNPIPPGRIDLPFLFETTDIHENNLYPFVHLAPDGNVFILANFKAILLDVRTNMIVRKYPDLPGGARNYPGSASAAILPIDLNKGDIDIEVLVCGGGQPLAFGKAEKEGIFLPALDTCGRIQILNPLSNWETETMPAPRVMSDMLNLPNGEIILLNGAKKGASGWQFADEPILTPFLYSPNKPNGERFKVLAPSQIPRMYHSSSAVLPDGKILVAGSNTNPGYQFANVKFPTELRVEKFSPPYLDPELQNLAPKDVKFPNKAVLYGQIMILSCNIAAPGLVLPNDVMVTLYKPPFTTHGYSMDQRILKLKILLLAPLGFGNFNIHVLAPPRAEIAPPGYYLLFVNYRGVPSPGSWVQLH